MWVDKKRFEDMEKEIASLNRRVSEAYSALESYSHLTVYQRAEMETSQAGPHGYIYYGPQFVSAKIQLTDAVEAIAKHVGLELKYVEGKPTRAEFQPGKKVTR
jgi:predicted transcriptional regulator